METGRPEPPFLFFLHSSGVASLSRLRLPEGVMGAAGEHDGGCSEVVSTSGILFRRLAGYPRLLASASCANAASLECHALN